MPVENGNNRPGILYILTESQESLFVCHTYANENDPYNLVEKAVPGTFVPEYSEPQSDGGDGQETAEEERDEETQTILAVHFWKSVKNKETNL